MNDPLPKAEGGADTFLGGAQGGARERWKSNAKRHENRRLMSRRGQEARWLGQVADRQSDERHVKPDEQAWPGGQVD